MLQHKIGTFASYDLAERFATRSGYPVEAYTAELRRRRKNGADL